MLSSLDVAKATDVVRGLKDQQPGGVGGVVVPVHVGDGEGGALLEEILARRRRTGIGFLLSPKAALAAKRSASFLSEPPFGLATPTATFCVDFHGSG